MNLDEKEAEFTKMVYESALDKYDAEMLDEFIMYWTEPNKSQTKVRWEAEKFFHVGRRLATWAKRSNSWNKAKNVVVKEPELLKVNFNKYG